MSQSHEVSDDPVYNEILRQAQQRASPQLPRSPTRGVALTAEQCDAVLRNYSPNQLDQFRDQALTLRLFIDEMLPQLEAHTSERIETATAPLLARIKELEERPMPTFKYVGVWKSDSTYRENEFLTFDGSLFVATRTTTTKEMPQDGSGAFILCAKRGRDAKLPKDINDAVREVQRLLADEQQHRAASKAGNGVATER